ncbi:T9SS type A sorting domain-containing protein [candidate division WOR-3 bacterium]|nr:T9SS type A sorting domain-containing protein [candidate division WOR-3 bacterium]
MKKGLFFFMCVSLVVPGVCKSGSNCWVANYGDSTVVKLRATGTRLCELDAVGLSLEPTSLDIDLQTGWCWEASTYKNRTHRISPDCDSVKEHTFANANPSTPCVDGNGYCWYVFMYTKKLVKVDENFAIIKEIPDPGLSMLVFPTAAAIDLGEQALWVTENDQMEGQGSISKFLCSGTTYQFRKSGFKVSCLDVDQATHCCWVADNGNNQVAKISSDGNTITRFDGFNAPTCVSVDSYTHCCWVADELNNRVVKLSEAGVALCVSTDFNHPFAVAADPLDHGCWVSDKGNNRVVKLDADCGTSFTVPDFLSPAGLAIDTITVGIEESKLTTPEALSLSQNYPNPFIQSTVISYQSPVDSRVSLKIYDIMGRLVRTPVNENKNAGYYNIQWNGKDESGKKVVSGIYFYKLETDNYTITKKMHLIR